MVIEWSDEYETGHPLIDLDHRGIVDIINRLEPLIDSEESAEVGHILCDLTDYVLVHFGHEETLMQRVRYPRYDEHMLSHCTFFASMTKFIFGFETGQTGLSREIQEFLALWLIQHESSEDREFVDYLKCYHPETAGAWTSSDETGK